MSPTNTSLLSIRCLRMAHILSRKTGESRFQHKRNVDGPDIKILHEQLRYKKGFQIIDQAPISCCMHIIGMRFGTAWHYRREAVGAVITPRKCHFEGLGTLLFFAYAR